jgi:hypothetical protein
LTVIVCALLNDVLRASAVNVTGGFTTVRRRVRSNTCRPCPEASETM